MKNIALRNSIALFALALVCSVFAVAISPLSTQVAEATDNTGVYEMLTDEVITIYETEIAHEKVVSDMKAKTLSSLAEKNGFTLNKTKTLILLSDLSGRVGDKKTFVELAKMNDLSILIFGKKCIDKYAKTLPSERQDELKNMFLKAIKK